MTELRDWPTRPTAILATPVTQTQVQRQLVPAHFVELQTQVENNWGSTAGRLNKPSCQRYLFCHGGKEFYLDLEHQLMAELELPVDSNFPYPLYVSPEVLRRETQGGAITIASSEDIIVARPGVQLVREQESQSTLNAQNMADLEQRLALQSNNLQALRTDLATLIQDRDRLRMDLAIEARERGMTSVQLQEATQELNELDELLANKNTLIAELAGQLRDSEKQLGDLMVKNNASRVTLEQLQQQLTDLQTQLAGLTGQLNEAQTAYQSLQRQLTQAQTDLQVTRDDHHQVRDELTEQSTSHQEAINEKEQRINQLEVEKKEQLEYLKIYRQTNNLRIKDVGKDDLERLFRHHEGEIEHLIIDSFTDWDLDLSGFTQCDKIKRIEVNGFKGFVRVKSELPLMPLPTRVISNRVNWLNRGGDCWSLSEGQLLSFQQEVIDKNQSWIKMNNGYWLFPQFLPKQSYSVTGISRTFCPCFFFYTLDWGTMTSGGLKIPVSVEPISPWNEDTYEEGIAHYLGEIKYILFNAGTCVNFEPGWYYGSNSYYWREYFKDFAGGEAGFSKFTNAYRSLQASFVSQSNPSIPCNRRIQVWFFADSFEQLKREAVKEVENSNDEKFIDTAKIYWITNNNY